MITVTPVNNWELEIVLSNCFRWTVPAVDRIIYCLVICLQTMCTPAQRSRTLLSPLQPVHRIVAATSATHSITLFSSVSGVVSALNTAVFPVPIAAAYVAAPPAHLPFRVARVSATAVNVQRSHSSHMAATYQGLHISQTPDEAGSLDLMMLWFQSPPIPIPLRLLALFERDAPFTVTPTGAVRASTAKVLAVILPVLLRHMAAATACSGAYVEKVGDAQLHFPGPVGSVFYDSKHVGMAAVVAAVCHTAPGSRRTLSGEGQHTGGVSVHHVQCERWILEGVACACCNEFLRSMRQRRQVATAAADQAVSIQTPQGPVSVSVRAMDLTGVSLANLSDVSPE